MLANDSGGMTTIRKGPNYFLFADHPDADRKKLPRRDQKGQNGRVENPQAVLLLLVASQASTLSCAESADSHFAFLGK